MLAVASAFSYYPVPTHPFTPTSPSPLNTPRCSLHPHRAHPKSARALPDKDPILGWNCRSWERVSHVDHKIPEVLDTPLISVFLSVPHKQQILNKSLRGCPPGSRASPASADVPAHATSSPLHQLQLTEHRATRYNAPWSACIISMTVDPCTMWV